MGFEILENYRLILRFQFLTINCVIQPTKLFLQVQKREMVQPNVKLFEKVSTETQTFMIFFFIFSALYFKDSGTIL